MSGCSQNVLSNLVQFYNNMRFADILVIDGSEEFACHRFVLAARSKYFERYFIEYPNSTTVYSPLEDVEMTKVLLYFMYSSLLPSIDANNVHTLLRASELLMVIEVSDHCYEYLQRNVGTLPIQGHFESFSFFYNTDPLNIRVHKLRDFILGHFEICLKSDESFLQVPATHWKYILAHYRSEWIPYESEDFLVAALIRWARADQLRKSDFQQLLREVDFNRVSIEKLKFLQGPLTPCRALPQPTSISISLLLVQHHADPRNPFETYYIFTKVAHTCIRSCIWPLSCKFVRNSQIYQKGTPALMTSTVLDEPNKLYCLEYDRNNYWPQFNIYDSPDALSTGSGREALARAPCKFHHRPSISGVGNKSDIIYLFGNDELLGNTRWALAQCRRPEFDDERAYKQCFFSYKRDVDNWFVVPFRGHELRSSCLVTDDTLAYMIGGHQGAQGGGSLGGDAGRFVQAYDYRQSSWTTLPMTTHLYHSSSRYRNSHYATGCSLNGEIFVSDFEHMEIYNQAAGRWREVPQPQSRKLLPDAWRKLIAVQNDNLLVRYYQRDSNIVCEGYYPATGQWCVSLLNTNVLCGLSVNDIFILRK